MDSLLKKLNQEGHIAIGAQTGSGKTLMLACSTMVTGKKVIYCSRTNDQLKNV